MVKRATHDDAIASLKTLAGEKAIVNDQAAHLQEWRGRWCGQTPLVLAPKTTAALSGIMAFCHYHDLPMVPQGGNTGLVGGQIPHGEILISTKRMRAIRDISPADFTMTLEAGVTLAEAQASAENSQRLFPLSIGSEGSCQIGGALSTNAGGVQVIRYGNMRDLTLGIETVLPDGQIWHGLNRLRKNNTGYDLKHLFIGAEGTLGIISAAVLKLFPQPAEKVTAFVALPSAHAAVALFSVMQDRSGGQITSFELLNAASVELVLQHFPQISRPVATHTPYYALVELSSGHTGHLQDLTQTILTHAIADNLVEDGTIARNEAQANSLWALRHHVSTAMKSDPSYCVKCDISVPIVSIPLFLDRAKVAVEKQAKGARIIAFGHLGDGNIHYDILGPQGADDTQWKSQASTLETIVHDVISDLNGSISAEHGIGVLKRDEMRARKDPVEMAMMDQIKSALDPKGLMNPGKLL